jgi:hypothetical protein
MRERVRPLGVCLHVETFERAEAAACGAMPVGVLAMPVGVLAMPVGVLERMRGKAAQQAVRLPFRFPWTLELER